MPMYDYRCGHCGARREVLLKLAELELAEVHCLKCDQLMARQISAPMVVGDYPGYECPVSGRWIEGRRAHIENLARTGCRILEPGEREASERRRKADDDALEKSIDETVERAIHEMPSSARDKLCAEVVDGGLSPEIVRSSPTAA